MNLKLIIIVSLIAIIFTSFALFGYIVYGSYDSTKPGKELFTEGSWMYYTEIGLQAAALVLAGFLFIKR